MYFELLLRDKLILSHRKNDKVEQFVGRFVYYKLFCRLCYECSTLYVIVINRVFEIKRMKRLMLALDVLL